jgi:hypothetical protein
MTRPSLLIPPGNRVVYKEVRVPSSTSVPLIETQNVPFQLPDGTTISIPTTINKGHRQSVIGYDDIGPDPSIKEAEPIIEADRYPHMGMAPRHTLVQ